MDIKTIKEFENLISQLQPTLIQIEKNYNNQATAIEQNCFNRANSSEIKFVECMQKKNEVYQKAFKRLEYHIAYWKNNTFKCFETNPKDITTCKSEAASTLQSYIQKCLKDV